MTMIPYFHVDAFAGAPFRGNQAAVMPLDCWPDDAVLQAIAEENSFAETAFIVPDTDGDAHYELRWFTPVCEVALCGHATFASGHVVLSMSDDLQAVTFRTRTAGLLQVARGSAENGGGYEMALPAYVPFAKDLPEAVAALGKAPSETLFRDGGYALFVYDDPHDVLDLQPDMRALAGYGDQWMFICTAPGLDTDILSRVFVPGAGIDEDSVTGSAHCVLTPFWAKRFGRGSFTAHQASRRGGYIGCELRGDRAVLSGQCVTVVEGQFNLA